MKLERINESILLEDIEAVRKNYPSIPDDVFNKILTLDPTYRQGSNSVGKYTKWMLNIYKKKPFELRDHIIDILRLFEYRKASLQNKDIGQFKSIEDLEKTLENTPDPELSARQQERRRKKHIHATDIGEEAELVYSDDHYEVYIPRTHDASCKLGSGTDWCTAKYDPYYFKHYSEQGPLYIILSLDDEKEKYQYHAESDQLKDIHDYEVKDRVSFFANREDLFKFFKDKLNQNLANSIEAIIEFFKDNPERVLAYTGQEIDRSVLPYIRKAIINAELNEYISFSKCDIQELVIGPNVKIIPAGFCSKCYNLTTVTISDGLETVGSMAFADCRNLRKIKLPDSVINIGPKAFINSGLAIIYIPSKLEVINHGVFANCEYLEDVLFRSDKNLIAIGDLAFRGCTSIKEFLVPNSVEVIGTSAFMDCSDLEVVVLPKSLTTIEELSFYRSRNVNLVYPGSEEDFKSVRNESGLDVTFEEE